MAKIRHNNMLNTVIDVMTNAKESGALHLYAEDEYLDGRRIQINGRKLFHFGTTGYLGLEHDQRLKQGAIEAIQAYGTQFPLSKSYISNPLYAELEALMTQIFNCPVVLTKNSTLGHLGVIPTVVNDGDGVILDHQVHWSVQSAVNPLKLRSVPVEMIRHNNLDMLEDKILKLQSKCNKIWYMADGMYSMFGDYAPIEELMQLMNKYPKLHIYFDDVHGMSWKGRNGSGYVMSVLKKLPDRVILFGTLSKTFGASGAVVVCKDKKIYQRIKNFGGPLTFSVQLEPAALGAAIASAKIHLSDEIYQMQEDLYTRIAYFSQCIKNTDLPLIIENDSPIFYIGAGMPDTGFNLVRRLMKAGYYVNTGIFPAVPVKNTGLRITICRNNEQEEMQGLVDAIVENFPKALADTHTSLDRVNFAFGRSVPQNLNMELKKSNLSIECYKTIEKIPSDLWNNTVGGHGFYDWDGLREMEDIFSDNDLPEHNYQFYYYLVNDANGKCILATFFTFGLWKEDMLAPDSVSHKIEKQREFNSYYHTSTCLCMGSMITEGEHLYLYRESPHWQEAFDLLLLEIENIERKLKPKYVILRDFETDDETLKDYLHHKGFVQVAMPEAAVLSSLNFCTTEDYINSLSKSSRKHYRKDIEAFFDVLGVSVESSLDKDLLDKCYQLYLEVKRNNIGLNTFTYPYRLFEHMVVSKKWEFILIKLKTKEAPIAGMMCCYRNSNRVYTPAIIGMDYNYSRKFNIYRQLLFQTVMRANEIGCKRIDFGLTAGFEKRKIGATVIQKSAYLQSRDNFILESLEWLRND